LDHVVMPAMVQSRMTPGTMPSVSNTDGNDKTPRPIWVFIIKPAVPSQPT